MSTMLHFDSTDEFPDTDEFTKIRNHYWVIAYKGELARPDWLMSAGRPIDVPNGSMIWRRPNYEEFLDWKAWWTEHGEQYADNSKYARSPHDIPLCECGHGEDSHHVYRYTVHPCRMSCNCLKYRPVEKDG